MTRPPEYLRLTNYDLLLRRDKLYSDHFAVYRNTLLDKTTTLKGGDARLIFRNPHRKENFAVKALKMNNPKFKTKKAEEELKVELLTEETLEALETLEMINFYLKHSFLENFLVRKIKLKPYQSLQTLVLERMWNIIQIRNARKPLNESNCNTISVKIILSRIKYGRRVTVSFIDTRRSL